MQVVLGRKVGSKSLIMMAFDNAVNVVLGLATCMTM